ncbi:MAG: HAD-IIIC family phosphatase [Nitrospirales bacterium]|nr:HAD-IIIC family phosphatase [Nitrospirales bacterium]
MNNPKFAGVIISDFNISNLGGYLSNDPESPLIEAVLAPYGQVVPTLTQGDLACWRNDPDFAVIWTRPEGVIDSFQKILRYEKVSIDKVLDEVDEYCALLKQVKDRVKSIFIPTWVTPAYHRGLGMLDMKTGEGVANTLLRMNLRLAENLEADSSYCLLDANRWTSLTGKNSANPKLWYMGKIAFANGVFQEATRDIKSALRAINGNARKLLLLDLDDTLWGGIVGDAGWKNLKLGGHDPIGEAFVDFQSELKSLSNRGILLGIVSKNEEVIALEAIDKHPEMVLRKNNFVGWRINWNDKAQNIAELVADLNLGLQSVVFLDDNPVERARVREALPEVLVPEIPKDKMLYRHFLVGLSCFDTTSVSKEDLARTKMYIEERTRKDLHQQAGSLDKWLKSLEMRVRVAELNEINLQRTSQLLNKTNQMNLSTRRMTESELKAWAAQENHRLLTFRVSDKFGDSGLTGILSLQVEGKTGKIVDFILSCRVIGRKIEETMIHVAVAHAHSIGLDNLCAKYLPTQKNKPCMRFFENSGFEKKSNDNFIFQLDRSYLCPEHVELTYDDNSPGESNDQSDDEN